MLLAVFTASALTFLVLCTAARGDIPPAATFYDPASTDSQAFKGPAFLAASFDDGPNSPTEFTRIFDTSNYCSVDIDILVQNGASATVMVMGTFLPTSTLGSAVEGSISVSSSVKNGWRTLSYVVPLRHAITSFHFREGRVKALPMGRDSILFYLTPVKCGAYIPPYGMTTPIPEANGKSPRPPS